MVKTKRKTYRKKYTGLTRIKKRRLGRQNVYVGVYNQRTHYAKRITGLTAMTLVKTDHMAGDSITLTDDTFTFTATGLGVHYFSVAFAHKLNDLPQYTEYTNMWDAYSLRYVKLKIAPFGSNTMTYGGSLQNQSAILYHYIVDKDDDILLAPASTGVDTARQYQGYRFRNNEQGLRTINLGYQPCVSAMIYNTAVTTAYSRKSKVMLDCTNDGVPHYGSKFIFEIYHAWTLPSEYKFKCEATYFLKLLDPR